MHFKLADSWRIDYCEKFVTIFSFNNKYLLAKFEIFEEHSLRFSVRVFGWMLTKEHDLYGKYERCLANVTLSSFTQEIEQYHLCKGIDTPDPKAHASVQRHVLQRKFSYLEFLQKSFARIHDVLKNLGIVAGI